MTDDKEFNEWLKDAHAQYKEGIEESVVFTSLVTGNFLSSPTCALQMGLAILLDKPIVLIVDKDLSLPASLVRAAKVVQRIDLKSPEQLKMAVRAIKDLVESEGARDD